MKKEEINIRIESSTKKDFKKVCELDNLTMSEKLTQLIEKEVNSKNSIKLTLVRKIMEKYMTDFLFETFDESRTKIIEVLKNYLSFDFEVSEIIETNNIQFFQIFVNDNNKIYCLYCNIIHGKIL